MLFRILTAALLFFFFFIIINISFQTGFGKTISDVLGHIRFADKTIHFLFMTLFSFLLNGSLKKRQLLIAGQPFLLGSFLVTLFITLEECSQAFIPARNFEIMDLVCNYAGIYMGGLLILLLFPRLGHQTTGISNERNTTFSIQTIFHRTR